MQINNQSSVTLSVEEQKALLPLFIELYNTAITAFIKPIPLPVVYDDYDYFLPAQLAQVPAILAGWVSQISIPASYAALEGNEPMEPITFYITSDWGNGLDDEDLPSFTGVIWESMDCSAIKRFAAVRPFNAAIIAKLGFTVNSLI